VSPVTIRPRSQPEPRAKIDPAGSAMGPLKELLLCTPVDDSVLHRLSHRVFRRICEGKDAPKPMKGAAMSRHQQIVARDR
jgi:hypothetical protein